MKKLLLVLCIALMAFGLVACSHECESCGKDGASKVEIMGESGYLCENCESLARLGEAFMNMQ